ncbi:Fic family protein [Cyclonatronum proteinivorum]|uniref:Fic family protein n=1 Tax=Cyclonatronum proteinivorum TaxID=1457365 RepID=A0A345UFU1_9BACT|nr:Fic/DOC family N-terminal domain-containing protein [Cyclonatronum proteinivorum]AXI99342.1 Fic family protein [Cyclonatronum proteinivorum]
MKPYKPQRLPIEDLDWSAFIELVGKANRFVARYDGLLQSVVNPEVLLAPLRTQEAVLSSKIEGTQATLEDVMEFEADADTLQSESKYGDILEVINYRRALLKGKEQMNVRPINLNDLLKIHEILLRGVRGERKAPGNFRKIQNWIGSPGSTMEQARFVPPAFPDMMEGLYNWEKYLHHEDKDVLVQLAIVHAQFEILHPFIDGNGRIGRILIPLFLFHKGIIHQPVFYMSQYLDSNRQLYYDALKEITDTGRWEGWIQFFLSGIIQQAEKNVKQTREIISLYDTMKTVMVDKTHSQYSIQCLDYIFSRPVFNTSDFNKSSGVPKTSASRLLKGMEENGIISCVRRGAGRKPGVFAFRKLLDIANQ